MPSPLRLCCTKQVVTTLDSAWLRIDVYAEVGRMEDLFCHICVFGSHMWLLFEELCGHAGSCDMIWLKRQSTAARALQQYTILLEFESWTRIPPPDNFIGDIAILQGHVVAFSGFLRFSLMELSPWLDPYLFDRSLHVSPFHNILEFTLCAARR